jgi:electron transfer flavoprotein beta subunit
VHIDYALAPYVAKIESIEKKKMVAKRLVEDGYEVVSVRLPAVVTVVKEINEPRTPSLRGKMAAKKAQIIVWTSEAIEAPADKGGLLGSPTQVVKVFTPPMRGGGEVWEGEAPELAEKLAGLLKELEIV